jgi:Flp pilus assembly protein TadG
MKKRRGIAITEFALVLPFLMLILAGVVDFAMLLRTATGVADAARAGAAYGSRSASNSLDTAGMQSAATKAAYDITGLTVTPTRSCKCADGSAVSCTGSCAAGAVRVYVQVTTQSTSAAIFSYPGLPYSGAVSATALMRVQ